MQGMTRSRVHRAGAVLIALAAILTVALLARSERSNAASSKPNIVMFTTDDQTVRDMLAMPNTQAIVGSGGTSFAKAFVSMSLCCPSRVSVQTGQYAHNHGVLGNTPPAGGYSKFNDKNDLPLWLQAAGYRTIHIGKMPNGFPVGGDATYVPPGWGPYPVKGEFYGFLGPPNSYTAFQLNENGVPKQYWPDDYQTDVYADKAVKAIDDATTLFPNSPFYMQLQFFAPHDPNVPAPRHAGAFASLPLPVDKSFNEKNLRDKPPWVKRIKRIGGGLRSKIQARWQGRLESLLAVDEAVAKISNELIQKGVYGNTYLIFTSDNGFMQGQHRLHQGKFVAYEPSVQVPLMIRGPGIPAGGISQALVDNVDLASTILDMAKANPGLLQDGRSILPYATDPLKRSMRPILLETGPPGAIGEIASARRHRVRLSKYVKNLDLDHTAQLARAITAPRYRGIRTNRYKLIKYGDGGRELYDLLRDPLEINSVYNDPRYFRVRKFLLKKLAKLSQCAGPTCNPEYRKLPKPLKKAKRTTPRQ